MYICYDEDNLFEVLLNIWSVAVIQNSQFWANERFETVTLFRNKHADWR